jgi:16S rRNA (cytidine1402-2'-O)-methyltransferase
MKLFLIPTFLAPDTASDVLSPQVREAIIQTDDFLVENVRTARRFISELKVGKVIDQLRFTILDKDTASEAIVPIMKQLQAEGKNIGVISEAGCPGIADPGAVAVAVAHRLGIDVEPLVGPSSIFLALMASGFSGQSFVFHGYLPIDRAARVKAIQQLEKEASQKKQTQIFMETPFRNNHLLEDVLTHARPDTLLCVASNITAPDQLLQTKTIAQWRKNKPDIHKKPTIFLIG